MVKHGYATGHGDTIEDLLAELDWQIQRRRSMTDRELMQQALSALVTAELDVNCEYGVTDSLRARLAQPENKFNPDWDAMAVMVEEQQRMAKRIEGLEAQLAQPEPAECDGGQCGIGGYCKDCPKTKPELKIINMENFVGSGKPLVPVCWMNANDIDKTDWKVWAHGKPTVSMPLFASPPQREWVGLTNEEINTLHYELKCAAMGATSTLGMYRILEKALKEKNT